MTHFLKSTFTLLLVVICFIQCGEQKTPDEKPNEKDKYKVVYKGEEGPGKGKNIVFH